MRSAPTMRQVLNAHADRQAGEGSAQARHPRLRQEAGDDEHSQVKHNRRQFRYVHAGMILMLFGTSTYAQPQQSPTEQALSSKLLQEINTGLACAASAISLQQQLTAAQVRIAELEKQLAAH